MDIYQMDDQNASHVARLMTTIRSQWWPPYEDVTEQAYDWLDRFLK